MDFLMTRTKGRGFADFIVMTSDTSFYQDINIVKGIAYNNEYKLQDGEWFVLDSFTQKSYCWNLLKAPFDSTAYSNLPRNKYPKMSCLYAVQDNTFYFQKMTNGKVLQKKLLSFSLNAEPICLNMDYAVVINDIPDAVYNSHDNKLFFRRLSDVTNIFVGIDELYKEATESETTDFLNLDLLNVDADFTADKVKTANRRRIKEAMDKYNSFTEQQKEGLHKYLQKYNTNLPYEPNTRKFKISSETELTDLLNGINQRYYTTEIDEEKRLANSVTKL